ncbi:unnamed protein product [Fusarium venenatum]|uniref:Uncharacterized protein n=1 Tax=Fusarium venenatum TaxID=56646 RepID=A0A2L2TEF7_9HYPO|nr:unnamed protein product [Fusarium venenatum]
MTPTGKKNGVALRRCHFPSLDL